MKTVNGFIGMYSDRGSFIYQSEQEIKEMLLEILKKKIKNYFFFIPSKPIKLLISKGLLKKKSNRQY